MAGEATAVAPGPRTAATAGADLVADTVDACRRHLGSGRAALGQLLGGAVEAESQGAWVTAVDGRRYLDFGGYGVFILGHRHPAVVAAVHRQLDRHPLATRVFLEPVSARAAAALAQATPPGLEFVQFLNSGTEATEAALKLARANGYGALVSASRGFHGKTMGALSVTANPLYQQPFAPLLPDVTHVPYGDIAALRGALAARAGRACLVLEPVLGEGGVVIPPDGYLAAAAQACREYGGFLIIDEIQTGLGRLGTWWGITPERLTPDVLLVGKGLSGGVVPVAAMVATAEAFQPFDRDPFLHSSTFGGSPLACAAALAAIEVIGQEEIVPRAAALGTRLLDLVRDACQRHLPGHTVEVRGRGLLLGVEFHDPGTVGEVALALMSRGVVVNHSLNAASVLRLTPPAVLTGTELELFAERFDGALASVAGRIEHPQEG